MVDYRRPGPSVRKPPSHRWVHLGIVIGSTALSIGALYLSLILSPSLIAAAIGSAFQSPPPEPVVDPRFVMATFGLWPLCLLLGLAVGRSGRPFKLALMLLCLAPGVGWGTACLVAEHNLVRETGSRVLAQNLTLPSPARIHKARWLPPDVSPGEYASFRVTPADFDQLIATNQCTQITADDLDAHSGFRPIAAHAIGNADQFYRGKNRWGVMYVIRVNRDHTEAILHVGG